MQIKLIKEESLELVTRHIVRSREGKFSFSIEEEGSYKICAQNVIPSFYHEVFMQIKIESDATDEFDISKVVKKSDFSDVAEKINNVILKSQKILARQKQSMLEEDNSYGLQHKYTTFLVGIFVFQILLVLFVGVLQLWAFRSYLIYNKVI